jgi:ornithine cyclodeaminase
MAMIGAGGQSADQIRAVCSVRPIAEVRIASLSTTSARILAERLGPELAHVRFVPVSSNREAVSEADVICTATASISPLFGAGDLSPTVHVNAVGAYTPDMCELPAELLRDARVVAIDQMEAAMAEAGDLLQAMSRGYLEVEGLIELGTLLASPPPPAGGWTVFKSVGIAAQDLEVAELAVREVRRSGRAAAEAFEIGQS